MRRAGGARGPRLPGRRSHDRSRLLTRAATALAAVAAALAAFLFVRRAFLPARVATALIVDPEESTTMDAQGAVTSVQAADLTLPEVELDRIWTPRDLERLARTYWRFLSRCTLGLIRVEYTEGERFVVLLTRPFVLLRFQAPEYEMDGERGIVRWRIEDGVLVSRRGKGGDGYLKIDVCRRPSPEPGMAVAHVEVEVANFYPFIAESISRRVYRATQSTIHVLVTHGFLRTLARLDLAESRAGRFAEIDEVPDPPAATGRAGPLRAATPGALSR